MINPLTGVDDGQDNPLFARQTVMPTGMMPTGLPSPDMNSGGNVFGGQVGPNNSIYDILDRIYGSYQPEHQANDALMAAVQGGFPERNTPTRMQNILGFLGGLGEGAHAANYVGGSPVGFRGGSAKDILGTEDLIRFRPFYQQMGDWEAKIKPLEAAANVERQSNALNRQLTSDTAARAVAGYRGDTYAQRVDQQGEHMANQDAVAQQNADTRAKQVAINQWRAQHPNHVIKASQTGQVFAIDPQSGQAIPVTDKSGRPVRITSAAELQAMIGNRQVRLENLRGQNALTLAAAKGNQARMTQAAKPTNAGRFDRNAQINLANKVLLEHPEWKNYIDPKTGGIIPSKLSTLDEMQQHMMLSALYGPQGGDINLPQDEDESDTSDWGNDDQIFDNPTPKPAPQKNQGQVLVKKQQNAQGQTRYIESTDGGKTWHLKQ
jgi:hypothetical protein